MSVAMRVAACALRGDTRGERRERHFADSRLALVADGSNGVAAGIICHHVAGNMLHEAAVLIDGMRAASGALWDLSTRHADLEGAHGAVSAVVVRREPCRIDWASIGGGRILHRRGSDLHVCNRETAWLVGVARTIDHIETGVRTVEPGDDILIVSDGASELPEPAILDVLGTFDEPSAASLRLLTLGGEAKPRQDVTVVVMRVR